MKKNYVYIIVVLFLPLIFLAGCGKEKRPSLEDRVNRQEQVSRSYEGVIERLEKLDVYQPGTHRLLTGEEAIFVQSPTIDLNRYAGETVLVKGRVVKGIGNTKDVFTVEEIAYADASKSAELKSYENKLHGFKFSYPSTWLVSEVQNAVELTFGEDNIAGISVFSDSADLDAFVSGREEGRPTEVTIGAQRAFRYTGGSAIRFYVPNPPQKKIYLIQFYSTEESRLQLFYNLLDSFELIYMSQPAGEKCGGLQQIKCSEGQICQLENDGKYAEGVCVPIGGEATLATCPFIAPPVHCDHYRISEYSQRGCPSRYECVSDEDGDEPVSFRDLNIVEAGSQPEDDDFSADEKDNEISEDEKWTERDYSVPKLSDITVLYANERKGFSLLMPRTWYFASFGSIEGALWKVGFSDSELEEPEQSVIMLSLLKEGGGRAYKKISDTYYVFDGPADLTEVMQKMADSIEASD